MNGSTKRVFYICQNNPINLDQKQIAAEINQ